MMLLFDETKQIAEELRIVLQSVQVEQRIHISRWSLEKKVTQLIQMIYDLFFPERIDQQSEEEQLKGIMDRLEAFHHHLIKTLHPITCASIQQNEIDCDHPLGCRSQAQKLLKKMPQLRAIIADDVKAAYEGDPAASSCEEIIMAYPGILAVTVYRVAHELHQQGVKLIPRMMTERAHSMTGIDIHPGSQIGKGLFIDHGTGVVIGETCEIGNHVKIYQGVTLGALSVPQKSMLSAEHSSKRHPTIESDVTIYAGATILGGETTIGRNSLIGGNVWCTESIPPHSKAINRPTVEVRFSSK